MTARGSARRLVLAILFCAGAQSAQAELKFHFTAADGTPQNVIDGFYAAGAIWSSYLHDDVDVNLHINWLPWDGAISLFNASNFNYSQVRDALIADRTSNSDYLAASHLQTGDSLAMLINRTQNSPYGAGNATPYLDADGDANNTLVAITYANAKALGLRDPHDSASDGQILIDNQRAWNFAPGGNFIRTAAHEIGHALGFMSGVDAVDINSQGNYYPDDWFTYVSSLDYFRYSTLSVSQGPNIFDFSADSRDKYFSIDGGVTKLASFSTGENWGNGIQNSHWRSGTTGVMGYGSAGVASMDVLALDVIGWNVAEVPEASSVSLSFWAAAAGLWNLRRRRG
jgi:hypothetical protein